MCVKFIFSESARKIQKSKNLTPEKTFHHYKAFSLRKQIDNPMSHRPLSFCEPVTRSKLNSRAAPVSQSRIAGMPIVKIPRFNCMHVRATSGLAHKEPERPTKKKKQTPRSLWLEPKGRVPVCVPRAHQRHLRRAAAESRFLRGERRESKCRMNRSLGDSGEHYKNLFPFFF